jgi:capsular exopolysaccharide synthesis family protein
MRGQAVALTIQGNRLVRMDDATALQSYAYRGGWEPRHDSRRRSLWTLIVRHRWLMLGTLVLALAAGVASVLLTTPVFRAQALVQVEPEGPAGPRAAADVQGQASRDRNGQIDTLTDLLTSRSTAQHAAARLRLSASPSVVRDFHKGLGVDRPGDSRAIAINYDSTNAQFAARAANAYAETFVADSLQRRVGATERSLANVDRLLVATKARLERAERNVVDYARGANLLDTGNAGNAPGAPRQSITTASLVDLNGAYLQAQAAKAQAQQRWQQANATPVMNLPEVLGNPAIQNLTRQRAEYEATLQQELQRRQAEHPAVVQARAQLAELDRQIGLIAAGVRASIGNQYRVAAGQEAALAGKVNGLKAASFAEQRKNVRYDILKREAETSRGLYNSLQQRHQQLNIDATETTGPVSLIDRAQVPVEPVRPVAALNMTVASVAGVALALMAGLARDRTDRKVRAPSDLEYGFEVPLLGVVPLLKNKEMGLLDDPRSPIAEAHHAICLALEPFTLAPEQKVLLLTSSFPGEGKSTTALKLAASLAAVGKKVLVIDGDMRRGSLHLMLQIPNGAGLANLLSREADAGLIAMTRFCESQGFSVLTRGQSLTSPAELLAGGRFAALLDEAVGAFDTVIIDGPPVLGLADAPRLSSKADATIFVLEANRTSQDDAEAAVHRLRNAGAVQIGIVLTKYDRSKNPGAYDYGYNYDYGSDDRDQPVPEQDAAEEQRILIA